MCAFTFDLYSSIRRNVPYAVPARFRELPGRQRELYIDRVQTQQVLSDLNLLELVHGRITTTSAQSKSHDEIVRRLESATGKLVSSDQPIYEEEGLCEDANA